MPDTAMHSNPDTSQLDGAGGTHDADYPYAYSAYRYTPLTPAQIEARLRPLVARFEACDRLRTRLETEGGTHADLVAYTEALAATETIEGRYRAYQVCPADPVEVQRFLDDVGAYRVHLQARRRANTLPVWCVCRARRDYWEAYSLVVETYYQSPGYPARDDRFLSILSGGRETPHINLAPYRERAAALVARHGYEPRDAYYFDGSYGGYGSYGAAVDDGPERRVDHLLYDVGRHVFSAAWHDDQEVAVLVSRALGIPSLERAIELLYLCLGGALGELRGVLSPTLLRFFVEVYPHPPLHRLLRALPDLDGPALNELAEGEAPHRYLELMGGYRLFLETPVARAGRRREVALRDLLFSNLSRPDLIAEELRAQRPVVEAAAALEATARRVIRAIAA